jgi:hypothetical protein
MQGAFPEDPDAFQKQALIYRSLLEYVLHFFPKISALTTWGFTDRYSWIPVVTNHTGGDAVLLDCEYQPKPAYRQLLEGLARVLVDGVYRISPQSQPNKCLGTSNSSTNTTVQLYSGKCNKTNQKWNVTWLGDGTYRFSPQSANNSALNAYNTTAAVGGVETNKWTGNFNQEWVIRSQGNNIYCVGPRTTWWRVLSVDEASHIFIGNDTMDHSRHCIFSGV